LNEVIDPLDYEEFLFQHTSVLARDQLRNILDLQVNINDVLVKIIPRQIRTVEHCVPKEELSTLPLYVQHCVDCYTRPWKTVQFTQRHHSSSVSIRTSVRTEMLTPSAFQQEFEIDREFLSFDETTFISCPSSRQSMASLSSVSTDTLTPRGSWASFDLRSSVNDPLITGLLDRIQPEVIGKVSIMSQMSTLILKLATLQIKPTSIDGKRSVRKPFSVYILITVATTKSQPVSNDAFPPKFPWNTLETGLLSSVCNSSWSWKLR
jgi:Domain of unknown function (DUF3398)